MEIIDLIMMETIPSVLATSIPFLTVGKYLNHHVVKPHNQTIVINDIYP